MENPLGRSRLLSEANSSSANDADGVVLDRHGPVGRCRRRPAPDDVLSTGSTTGTQRALTAADERVVAEGALGLAPADPGRIRVASLLAATHPGRTARTGRRRDARYGSTSENPMGMGQPGLPPALDDVPDAACRHLGPTRRPVLGVQRWVVSVTSRWGPSIASWPDRGHADSTRGLRPGTTVISSRPSPRPGAGCPARRAPATATATRRSLA